MVTERTIKKHVAIIHAYSLMSSLQRKVVNVLLYEAIKKNNFIDIRESVAVECRIHFSNLSKEIRFISNNTRYLKEAIDGLASLKIEWNLLKDKVPTNISFLNLRVLHGAPTFYQDGSLNFSFHKVMLDLVDNPSIYGTINLDIQSRFESKYGHSLYENSTRFVNLQKSKVIQLNTFRKLLGVSESNYSNMGELKRNVIQPAIEEVNELADFVVNLEEVKNGRRIVGYDLFVNSKKKPTKTENQGAIDKNDKVCKEIEHVFGSIRISVLENILKNYSAEYILEKVAYTVQHAKKDNSGFYPIPYFISALKHDYKVKDNIQSQNTEKNIIDSEALQNDNTYDLQMELQHWRRVLEYTRASRNGSDESHILELITNCEGQLRQHSLKDTLIDEKAIK